MSINEKQIESLAKQLENTCFFDYLKEIKDHIADVRTPIVCPPEHEVIVRKAICEVIDDWLVSKFKVLADKDTKNNDNWV